MPRYSHHGAGRCCNQKFLVMIPDAGPAGAPLLLFYWAEWLHLRLPSSFLSVFLSDLPKLQKEALNSGGDSPTAPATIKEAQKSIRKCFGVQHALFSSNCWNLTCFSPPSLLREQSFLAEFSLQLHIRLIEISSPIGCFCTGKGSSYFFKCLRQAKRSSYLNMSGTSIEKRTESTFLSETLVEP